MKRGCWNWGVLAGALLGAWAGTACAQPAPPGAKPADRVVAAVNDEKIMASQLEAALRPDGKEPVPMSEAQKRQRQMEVLSLLIDELLMHQFLDKNTPVVPPAEVAQRLAEMEAGLKAQGKSLAEWCHDTNQTLEQFRGKMADLLRWTAYVAPKLTPAALEQYYKDNKDYFDDVRVHARHIVLRLPEGAPDAERQKAHERLKAIREEITSGKIDFGQAAKRYSQDPRAADGGDLGFFPRKWVWDEPFARAAFALKVNEVSDVVPSDYGLHLVQVLERKAGQPSDYNKIKEAVREFCEMDLRQQVLGQLRKTANIKIDLP
jgi:peptidyl-prolyl cis-trans isomerase C